MVKLARSLPVEICPVHHCLFLPPWECPKCYDGEPGTEVIAPALSVSQEAQQSAGWGEIGIEAASDALAKEMVRQEMAALRPRFDWWSVILILAVSALVWGAGWLLAYGCRVG